MDTIDLKKKFEDLKTKIIQKKNDEVIKECNIILKDNKVDVFYNLLCLAYNNKNDFKKAIEIMNAALRENPKNVDFLNNLGMFYFNIFEYKKAEEQYKKD